MKWIRSVLIIIATIIVLGILAFLLGPRPNFPKLDNKPARLALSLDNVEAFVQDKEQKVMNLKPDNEAQLHWANDTPQVSEYSLVYLPGYSASHYEAYPLHLNVAHRYGMNAFLARIADHGIADTNAFRKITPTQLLASAKEAIAVGKTIGKKVVVLACSTGATYATYLAAKDPGIAALIFLSPNFALHTAAAPLLNGPWSYQLLRLMFAGEYRTIPYTGEANKYWAGKYHINGLIALQDLLEQTMRPDIFAAIHQPLFIAYYYKDEENFDKIVSIEAMHDMFGQVQTPPEDKRIMAIPTAGGHVIGSAIQSKDVASVEKAVCSFIDEVLAEKLTKFPMPVPNPQSTSPDLPAPHTSDID